MSATETLAPSTHSAGDEQQLRRVYDMLTVEEALSPRPRHYPVGRAVDDPSNSASRSTKVLLRVVDAMSKGLCVTVSPTSRTPITPQSADVDEISCIDQILADVHRTRKAIAAERREAEAD